MALAWPRGVVMIWYVAALHIAWGLCLWIGGQQATWPTSIAALTFYVPSPSVLGGCLIVAGLLAIWGSLVSVSVLTIVALLPQQLMLIVVALSALRLSVEGHFADGVIRPPLGIFADQAAVIFAAIGHTVAASARWQWKS
jgi:hypothetical protein